MVYTAAAVGSLERRCSLKIWHAFVLFLVMFGAGTVPLLLTLPDEQALLVTALPENPGAPSPKAVDEVKGAAVDTKVDTKVEEASASPLMQVSLASSPWPSAQSLDCPSTDLRLLVIAADGEDATLPAIRQVLDYLGTPYTVYVAGRTPGGLTPDKLASGCHAFYQGIILTTGNVAYSSGAQVGSDTASSALTDAEWQTLRDYEARFGVRRVAWYAYTTPEYGLQNPVGADTSAKPIEAECPAAGQDVFSYANLENSLDIVDV